MKVHSTLGPGFLEFKRKTRAYRQKALSLAAVRQRRSQQGPHVRAGRSIPLGQ
jgi:hypothetical protein